MPAFDTFRLWYAKSIADNAYSDAANTMKISNSVTPAGEAISMLSCTPSTFAKRVTDVSEALAADKLSPDTGTGLARVELRIMQERGASTLTVQLLARLLAMFYVKGNDPSFRAGRFGLQNTDCPELDVLPVKTAGYKIISFVCHPEDDKPSLLTWYITLEFLGDHSLLGTRS